MRRLWAAAAVAVVVVLAGAGIAAGLLIGDGAPAARPGSSQPSTATPSAQARTRILVPALSRDAPQRLFVTDLARDRRDAERLSLWVGGDSTAVYMGQGLTALARALGGTVSGEFYKNSTGLTRPDFFDWRQEFADEMARARPNVAVVMLGANDLQGIVAADGRSYQPGTDGWRAEYTRRLDAALDTLTADPDRLVVWVGQPIMEPSEYNAGIQQLNDLFAAEAQKRPNVVYVDAYDLFADGHGQYQVRLATAQGDQDLRAADGIHFTVAGGQYLADAVMKAIRSHKELILGGSAGG